MPEFQYAKHDAIEIENVPPTIQVIDPSHPLFGNTYPLINLTTPHGLNWLSVEMPCGYIRIIPHEATNLYGETLDIEQLRQSLRISPFLMLRLQQLLQRQQQTKEDQDEGNDPETEGNTSGGSNAVAPIDSTAAGADRGSCATNSPPVAKTYPAPGGGE